ncbi:efflux transporter outer membrane subunit [Burkholderia ubonensis]|uniref:RND transporter n=1 Tax=Burkholderia ubonensis TaxID=101571 RepID=A0AB74DGN1_9BURK|nr:efflux transporter outer membrane subunit [Burkholderia ubonensis]PAJ82638.1 RND transporter [Burkholderia ubonensis]PAJ87170.1 RND transporter [Burkholderia ubonensis]PAJ93978.1 RND transporter [Burkholderia ubonensis]PAJ98520.1 RND transporter [Burkholderia ubonensis]PAK09769.1 RND transporter [Burkholderia ubonensis]
MQSPAIKGTLALAVLAVSLIMTGCASMGDNKPQSTQIDPGALDAGAAIRGAAIRAADRDAGWPAADWWRAYRDPQLDAWIAAAQAGNPTLAAAQARVREAQAMARVARSAELPQINGNLSLMRQHWPDNVFYGPGPLANADTWNNTGTLGLSYHLDLWGKDKNATERALDAAHASAADARAARLELEVNVVRAYVGLSMNYALLDLAHDTFERQRALADLARKRLQAGLGTQLEVSQAESTLPDYERQIDTYEEAIQLARHQLAALAGKGPGAGDSITRPKLALDAPAGLPSALPADLLGRRPDVVAARWTVDAQARGIDVAKAAFYPNIDLLATVGGFGVTAPFADFLRAMNGGWTAGPALSLPIFEGGRLRAQLGAASAGYDQAVERYNQTIVGALKDIADQVVRIRSLDTQKKDAARSVAANDRSYQLSREGFRRGLTDYVNVLVAQQQLLRAQETAARIDAERLSAHAALMAALGGGVETGEDVPGVATSGAKAPAATSGVRTPAAAASNPKAGGAAPLASADAARAPAAR